ncbi:hypothetical protein BMS3Abin03_01948 [bacterium BMS3Abin03]|nr:hypothetical protein BMS3Abin03_01948 [bacterium BMS3Abin03]
MKTEYIAAIISGCFTLAVTLLSFLLKQLSDTKIYSAAGKRRNLTGKWRGQTTQTNGRIALLTSGEIKSRSKSIKGSIIVELQEVRVKIKFKGFYLDDDHILVNYVSEDSNIKNFGSQILRINADCNKLTGLTIGYGNVEEEIIQGSIVLTKTV